MPPEQTETRRELLEAAFDEAEKAPESDAPAVEVKADVVPPEPAKKAVESDAYKVEAEAAKKPVTEPIAPSIEANKPVVTEEKAPISWKAEEKEHWAKIPPEARAVIARRELEIQRALSSTAQTRKFAEEFARVINPYAHLIRAQNSTPIQAVDNLMRTAAGLTVGSQEQKAAIVAEIISNYSIDIATLDQVLSKAQPSPMAGQGAIPPQFAQMLQPVYQFMEQVNQGRTAAQQKIQEDVSTEIQTFSAQPYFEELREDMADLMEMTANRGRTMTMQQAYERAVAAHPVYSKASEQNKNAQTVSEAAATLARARNAASSVKGSPGGGSLTPKTPGNRREALEAAWDTGSR